MWRIAGASRIDVAGSNEVFFLPETALGFHGVLSRTPFSFKGEEVRSLEA